MHWTKWETSKKWKILILIIMYLSPPFCSFKIIIIFIKSHFKIYKQYYLISYNICSTNSYIRSIKSADSSQAPSWIIFNALVEEFGSMNWSQKLFYGPHSYLFMHTLKYIFTYLISSINVYIICIKYVTLQNIFYSWYSVSWASDVWEKYWLHSKI